MLQWWLFCLTREGPSWRPPARPENGAFPTCCPSLGRGQALGHCRGHLEALGGLFLLLLLSLATALRISLSCPWSQPCPCWEQVGDTQSGTGTPRYFRGHGDGERRAGGGEGLGVSAADPCAPSSPMGQVSSKAAGAGACYGCPPCGEPRPGSPTAWPARGSARVTLAAVRLQFHAVRAALGVGGLFRLQHHGPVPEKDEKTWVRREKEWVNPLKGPPVAESELASLPGLYLLIPHHHHTHKVPGQFMPFGGAQCPRITLE